MEKITEEETAKLVRWECDATTVLFVQS